MADQSEQNTADYWRRLGLAEHHVELLRASAIAPEVAQARQYQTISARPEDVGRLADLGFGPRQRGAGLLIPLHGLDGTIVGYQLRRDAPRLADDKPIKYENPKRQSNRLDVPPSMREAIQSGRQVILLCEGAKKVDAAASIGLPAINLGSVFGWRGKNAMGGSTVLADFESVAIRGNRFAIAFDSDMATKPQVHSAAQRLRNFLLSRGADAVGVLDLPDGPHGSKLGLDDWVAATGSTAGDVLARVRVSLPAAPAKARDDSLPVIQIGGQLRDITAAGLAALRAANEPPSLFVRTGHLTRVVQDADGQPQAEIMGCAALRGVLGRVATWTKPQASGEIDAWPPRDVAEDTLALGEWPGLPKLTGIATAPVLLPGGRLLDRAGYDARSGYVLADGAELPGMDTEDALTTLLDMLCDFPFDGEASRANALAATLTPFVRPAIDGPTPMFLFDAPKPGTGKGLLVKACATPFDARGPVTLSAGRDDEEWRKRLTTVLLAARPLVLIDNVRSRIDSAPLSAALTAWPTWADRLMGSQSLLEIPQRSVFLATGNNVALSDEIGRRVVWIRLDAVAENPWTRTGFRHEPFYPWLLANRSKVTAAVVTMIRDWLASGQPFGTERLGAFESWAGIVGGILGHAGVTGFLANSQELYDTVDPDAAKWKAFVAMWWSVYGVARVGTKELAEAADNAGMLDELVGTRRRANDDRALATSLGMLLGRRRGQVFGGFQIVIDPKARRERYSLCQANANLGVGKVRSPEAHNDGNAEESANLAVISPVDIPRAHARARAYENARAPMCADADARDSEGEKGRLGSQDSSAPHNAAVEECEPSADLGSQLRWDDDGDTDPGEGVYL